MGRYTIDNTGAPINFGARGLIPRTLQNARNLLMTRKGEVPYDRLRGFDGALFDLPIARFREALMPELDRVMLWEPDAEVVSAECEFDEHGELVVRVVLEIGIGG